ncbi:MAG: NAD(P)H-dependent oxidoreductase subunit E, partial [Candidatus Latescibacteria bacterium]|nr:NAD(P)H-dependent oxidoreductase subunit E [Candidatus Latescibacterota bacterium]
MSEKLIKIVRQICSEHDNDRTRMMDILIAVQKEIGSVNDDAIDIIAETVSCPRVEVDSTVSFYAFLSKEQKGEIVIRLCDDIIDRMNGFDVIAKTFSEELGIDFGETTPNGKITLERTPCIGMSDQAPAVMVNEEIITNLSSDKVRNIVRTLKETGDPKKLVHRFGSGNNSSELVRSMVNNNIR